MGIKGEGIKKIVLSPEDIIKKEQSVREREKQRKQAVEKYRKLGISADLNTIDYALHGMKKNKSAPLPEIVRVENETISPEKYPILKKIYGNFEPFQQEIIILKNSRDYAITVYNIDKPTALVSLSENTLTKKVKLNEFSHCVFQRLYQDEKMPQSYSQKEYKFKPLLKALNIKKVSITDINELLSDVASFNTKQDPNELSEFDRLNHILKNFNLLNNTTFSEFKNTKNLILQHDKEYENSLLNKLKTNSLRSGLTQHEDTIGNALNKQYQALNPFENSKIQTKLNNHGYGLTIQFFYYLTKELHIPEADIPKAYLEMKKELIPLLEEGKKRGRRREEESK